MKNTTQYYSSVKSAIEESMEQFSQEEDDFGRGAISLLHAMKAIVESTVNECIRSFPNDTSLVTASSVNSDTDSDTDSDE